MYIDHYFRTVYLRDFDRENSSVPNKDVKISFAHNARTLCIAFVAFSTRYRQGNITDLDLAPLFSASSSENLSDTLYETFRDVGSIQFLLPPQLFANKDQYDSALKKLFSVIIREGISSYTHECRHDPTLTATNYLKRDKNYYDILSIQWDRIADDLKSIFSQIGM